MTLSSITNSGPMPALELTMRFAGARQRLLAHNVANISTPDFRPMDVDPARFQALLADALKERRRAGGQGEVTFKGSRQIRLDADRSMHLRPETPSGNILFHDRNNRDIERMMQDLTENAAAYRVSIDLMSHYSRQIQGVLAERV